jgi:hypothetical protein
MASAFFFGERYPLITAATSYRQGCQPRASDKMGPTNVAAGSSPASLVG